MDEADRLMFQAWAKMPTFKRRLNEAIATIAAALSSSFLPSYISCSWGKDSTALVHLVTRIDPDIPVVFWTDPEQEMLDNYAEVIASYRSKFSINYIELDVVGDRVPHKVNISHIWEDYPVAFLGLRKEENPDRRRSLNRYGPIYQYTSGAHAGSWRVAPLANWTWRDVWAYIVVNDLPYLASYDHFASGDHSSSRTCNLLAKGKGLKGATTGRISAIRARNPEYYNYLKEFYPTIASSC